MAMLHLLVKWWGLGMSGQFFTVEEPTLKDLKNRGAIFEFDQAEQDVCSSDGGQHKALELYCLHSLSFIVHEEQTVF